MTTVVLNKPQTVSPTTMQLPFFVPPEMWYFSGKGMILRISQRILRGNGRRHNDFVLVLFRAMITSCLFSDFFAYHQRRKSFLCYSLLKVNILLSNFWTKMMFVQSVLELMLSTNVCWKYSTGLEIFLDWAKVLLPRVSGTLELPSFADVVGQVQGIPSVSRWDYMGMKPQVLKTASSLWKPTGTICGLFSLMFMFCAPNDDTNNEDQCHCLVLPTFYAHG